ncbi:MAG: DUF4349 domain-containing protein [bacterium]|nr:DUF4349 domain-containing protein [bacterium]
MPTQKLLKIAGAVLLVFFVLYFGLMIILSGSRNTRKTVSNQLAVGVMDSFQGSAPGFSGGAGEAYSTEIAMDSAKAIRQESAPGVSDTVDKKVIKTGNLSLKVEKAETAAENITNIAKLNKGEISNSYFSESSRGVKSGYLTVRVSYQNFEAVFNEIKKVATQVMSESSNAQDITAEFIDLEARLNNKRAEEVSFVALLNRSGKIEEVLAVTREIARTRGEIEQLEGQMRYLSSQTDMSTITVNLSEDVAIASASQDWRPWQNLKTSVKQLITNGQNFVDGLISFIIVVLPLLVIYALIIWLIYYIGKKVYRRYTNR